MQHKYIILLLAGIILAGCAKTQPQRPTVRGESTVDSEAAQMLMMNQQMAAEADRALLRYADSGFVMMDDNVWVKGPIAADTVWHENDYIALEARFYDLKGNLLATHQSQTTVGKVDEIPAIVDLLPFVYARTPLTAVAPWYMAFGSAGNNEVKPYENIRIDINIQ